MLQARVGADAAFISGHIARHGTTVRNTGEECPSGSASSPSLPFGKPCREGGFAAWNPARGSGRPAVTGQRARLGAATGSVVGAILLLEDIAKSLGHIDRRLATVIRPDI